MGCSKALADEKLKAYVPSFSHKHVANISVVLEIFSKDVEVAQGRNIADACKAAGVSHFIWSSLAHAGKGRVYLRSPCRLSADSRTIVSNGKMSHMLHFDSKAEVEEYTKEIGVPSTFFYAGCYMSNFPDALQKVSPQELLNALPI